MTTQMTPAQAARQNTRSAAGRYAEMGRYEPTGLDLASVTDAAARREQLLADGYLPAVAVRASISPRTAAAREQWWDEHFGVAEYDHADGTVPKLPDDETPSMTAGQSLLGNRRTHRMRYEGSGVVLRMPSATAIRRFTADPSRRTADVPVTIERPDGSTVSGWVRVTGERHTWDASALGFTGTDQAAISEAVCAVLEARRPTWRWPRWGTCSPRTGPESPCAAPRPRRSGRHGWRRLASTRRRRRCS